jgi:hypothetical protein
MRTKKFKDEIRKEIKGWIGKDNKKSPEILIRFNSAKKNPFQGALSLVKRPLGNKNNELKGPSFHSAGELLFILEVILNEYPLAGSKKI